MKFSDLFGKGKRAEPTLPSDPKQEFLATLSKPGVLELAMEDSEVFDSAPCQCCGSTTRWIKGFVNKDGSRWMLYRVVWAVGHAQHGTMFDLIIGNFTPGVGPGQRYTVSLEFRIIDGTPQFMVVDASKRSFALLPDRVSHVFDRADIVGSELAPLIFEACDFAYFGEERLSHLRGRGVVDGF